jgi:cytochrome c553
MGNVSPAAVPSRAALRRSRFRRASALILAAALAATVTTVVRAYDTYSTTSSTTGNCAACHGAFRTSNYISKVDGQSWGNSLHNVHRNTMLNGDCDTCHNATGDRPVYLHSSTGGTGLAAISCTGCHGRAADGTGTGTVGYGAGLRQRHYRAGQTVCVTCHADSNPANKTPVGEKIKPPYYANPGTNHPKMPTDPCNPTPAFNENFAASTLGLDNDGNGSFDAADPSCSVASATPGEAGAITGQLRVTAYDKVTGNLTVSYGIGCSTTNNNVEYGPLSAVSTYGYSGQVCAIGNTGTATFALPAGAYFFLVVGHDASAEGSYGTRVQGGVSTERPEDNAGVCPFPQNLTRRCD